MDNRVGTVVESSIVKLGYNKRFLECGGDYLKRNENFRRPTWYSGAKSIDSRNYLVHNEGKINRVLW